MNKLSSSPSRVGVRERISNPRTWSAKLKALGVAVGASALAACALNPAYQSSTGPEQDAGGRRDATADVGNDTTQRDTGTDTRNGDSGTDSAVDAGVDVAMDAGMDSVADAGVDAGTDAEDVAVVPPPPDEDGDGVTDADDVCVRNAARRGHDLDGDGCDDSARCPDGTACDKCLGVPDIDANGDGISDDSDRDGIGDPCDGSRYSCEIDDDGDGQVDCVDPCPIDPTNSCVPAPGAADAGPDASTVGEWLKKQIRRILKGRGESAPVETRIA